MNILDICEQGKLNKVIPKEKIIDSDNQYFDNVISVTWVGVIKPEIMNVTSVVTDNRRYEEIQFFVIRIDNRNCLHDIARIVYSKIKYPCIIIFQVDDAVIIGACEFMPGKINSTLNVKQKLYFSHFLRTELLSPQAEKMVDKINSQISNPIGSLGDIYNKICEAIMNYSLSGTTKSHVERLIRSMVPKGTVGINSVMKSCPIYEYYPLEYGNRYSGKRSSSKKCIYDYEEIWYCFMKCTPLREAIEKKRYRDIEDMVYSVDSKSW